MKYIYIAIFSLFYISGFSQDTIQPLPSSIQKDYTYSIKLDLFRFLKSISSGQVSFEYRPIKRIAFESELNYYFYMKYQNDTTVFSNDPAYISLNTHKINGYISAIAKVYLASSKKFYIGFKGVVGTTNFDISRRICSKSAESTSGDVCRCLEIEERTLSFQTLLVGYGPRIGLDIALQNRIRLDIYLDYFYNLSKPTVDFKSLEHDSCDKEFHPFSLEQKNRIPQTDSILSTLQNSYKPINEFNHQQSLSFSIKIAYVF